PYKATNIKEFWQRWHITLSRFLLNYVYVPLGGNRKGETRTLINILLLFVICGLWHGAAWAFVFWGLLTGLASIVYRLWTKTGLRLPKAVAWLVYFGFFNISAVFFRAQTWQDTVKVLKGMIGLSGIYVSPNLAGNPFWQKLTVIGIRFGEWRENLPNTDVYVYFLCFLLIPFVLLTKNSNELLEKFKPDWKNALAVSLMMIAGLLLLNKTSSFLYFNF
ncbi:MAG: membrane-bound O-acyltransferase family protein, partial [Candidatus Wallbacteria bacterium HGW-Wallbacteria-1]